MQSPFKIHKHPKIIAHRGNSSQAPENTSIAFNQAIQMRVDFLECDVQLSKDKVPLVIHDGTFHRITHNQTQIAVNELDFEEIKKIDAGSWFDEKFSDQRVLTLEEFFWLPKGKIGMMLDIKEETISEAGLAKVVADAIHKCLPAFSSHNQLLIGSLNPNILLCLEAYLPEQEFIPIIANIDHIKLIQSLRPKHYAIGRFLINPDLVDALHREEAEVWVWTVDDKQEAIDLIGMDVDGLITNHPKKMMALHDA